MFKNDTQDMTTGNPSKIIPGFLISLCFVNVVRFTIQEMGYSTFAIIAGVCEMAARPVCGFIMVPIFRYVAVCLASPFVLICADVFLVPAYGIVLKKMKKEIEIGIQEEKMLEKSRKPLLN